jgi:hypothetical protein
MYVIGLIRITNICSQSNETMGKTQRLNEKKTELTGKMSD